MEEKLKEDLIKAQIEQDALKVSTLRLLLSEIHNAQIQKASELTDEEVISVIQRELKKRKEAIEGFRSGGREEQAQKEEKESQVLEEYLPAQLQDEELTKIVEESITELEAKSLADMGKVMSLVMSKVAGRADGGKVSSLVKEKLS